MTSRPPASPEEPSAQAFREQAQLVADWIADYLGHSDRYPVLSRVAPGDIRRSLPSAPPEQPEPFERIFEDFQRLLIPGITHWNHPGFFGYFAITGSPPGVLGEFLCAALNVQAMLWRTSPAATELEEVTLGWLRQLLGVPASFEGVIYDTASVSTLHALATARHRAVPNVRDRGLAGRTDVPALRVYCSEHAHSSVDKAAVLLGLGRDAVVRVVVNDGFEMEPDALRDAVRQDRERGLTPMAVVATVGTTSMTSVDPVSALVDICQAEGMWLHVDAAYAGAAAMLPAHRHILDGIERADSLVVNPHKWLFTPFDLSAFYTRHGDELREAFSLVPDYLRTAEDGTVHNLMDTGVQLGRRFRALKLWMVLRAFGAEGIRQHLSEHIRLARLFAELVDDHADFERLAPVPFSVVCFRARPSVVEPDDLDTLNRRLLERVNDQGDVFLSHTTIGGRFTLRLAVGHLRTTETHVRRAWGLLTTELGGLLTDVRS